MGTEGTEYEEGFELYAAGRDGAAGGGDYAGERRGDLPRRGYGLPDS